MDDLGRIERCYGSVAEYYRCRDEEPSWWHNDFDDIDDLNYEHVTAYKVRCYKRNGDLDHEEFFNHIESAIARRTSWGLSIGLKPEPSSDFAYYPTIWRETENGYERVAGY